MDVRGVEVLVGVRLPGRLLRSFGLAEHAGAQVAALSLVGSRARRAGLLRHVRQVTATGGVIAHDGVGVDVVVALRLPAIGHPVAVVAAGLGPVATGVGASPVLALGAARATLAAIALVLLRVGGHGTSSLQWKNM